jgi:excisionase family DNA binding protein
MKRLKSKNVSASNKQQKEEKQRGLLTMEQAIKRLATSRPTFYRWLRTGRLQGLKYGGHWRFDPVEIDRFKAGEEPRINLRSDPAPLIAKMIAELRRRTGKDVSAQKHAGIEGLCTLMAHMAMHLRSTEVQLIFCRTEASKEVQSLLRYRIDGETVTVMIMDERLHGTIIDQWKSWAACNRNETFLPQEGRVTLELEGEQIEARLTTLPTAHGESMTLGLLFKSEQEALRIERLGLSPNVRAKVERALHAPWGVVLCAGAHGSGKTSTLYACMNEIASSKKTAVAVEESAGVQLPWVIHTTTKPERGLTMPIAIRSALRMNPEILLTGEMRERESWALAEGAAQNGRVILTQFAASNAISAILQMRILMGESFRRDTALKLVVAQRLVRKLCPNCLTSDTTSPKLIERAHKMSAEVGLPSENLAASLRSSCGCEKCGQLGFRGRMALYEALEISPELVEALAIGASEETIRCIAREQGFLPMTAMGLDLALQGKITLLEALQGAV